MKRLIWVAVFGMVMAGGIWWYRLQRAAQNTQQESGDTTMQYSGQEGRVPVRFQYPNGWRVVEEQGQHERYHQVRLLGPRNAEDTYTCNMSVRRSPLKPYGGTHASAADLIARYKAYAWRDATIGADRSTTVSGFAAHDLTASYVVPPPHQPELKAIAIPVTTRLLVIERPDSVYEIMYSADAREFAQHAPVFERLLNSLRLP